MSGCHTVNSIEIELLDVNNRKVCVHEWENFVIRALRKYKPFIIKNRIKIYHCFLSVCFRQGITRFQLLSPD